MSNHGNLDPTIANEVALLRAEVTRLEGEKLSLTSELEQVQRENRDFATMCVEAQEQNIAATNLYVVLPPSTVTQAARSSSTIGAVGSRLGTAHVIARMLTNEDDGRHTNTSRKVSRRVANPACIAGVRVSRPNFRAPCGLLQPVDAARHATDIFAGFCWH